MNHKITRTLSVIIFVALLITVPRAQQPAATNPQSSEDRVELYQALLDLQNPWTVMCIAAHPDDEDGTSLIIMRRKYGAHTVSLFSTFGEGGQNAIGPELYEELGAIRARETMAAAEIQGSEPHFLGLKDFGYSKSAEEAFRVWGHEEALRRMVLEIRKLRPDVIITNHSVTNNDHGHHQATARLELEAFDAAADPKQFPEQLQNGVTTWQVQRLFVRARGNAAQNPDRQGGGDQFVTIDPNERDPVRAVVYAEEALRALQQHATQGPWPKTFTEFTARFRVFSGQPGRAPGQLPMIGYALVREAKTVQTLPKESHNFLDGLRLSKEVSDEIEVPAITPEGMMQSIETRQLTRDVLIKDYRRGLYGLSSVNEKDRHRLVLMRSRLERAIVAFADVNVDVGVTPTSVTPGSSATVPIKINNAGDQPIELLGCSSSLHLGSAGPDQVSDADVGANTKGEKIDAGSVRDTTIPVDVPAQTPINVPVSNHLYEPTGLGIQFHTRCLVDIENTNVNVRALTRADVAPRVEITNVNPSPLVLTPGTINRQTKSSAVLINHRSTPFAGTFYAGYTTNKPTSLAVGNRTSIILAPGESREVSITLPLIKNREAILRENAPLSFDQLVFFVAEPVNSISETKTLLTWSDARTESNLRVGYIRGFDFSLPNALNALGVESKELTVDEVKTADLSKYTSVIVDNRVYESKPELIAVNQKLLDYAQAGGTLIVFYHKSDEWNPNPQRSRPQLSPYKLILGNERITDENAPITFLEPDHPLLNVPNKLNQEDFKDWIQERGLYYPREWDPQFHALLQSNDPGEAPLKGGLLVADYGKGHYIYTSMVWYRELRAGVPGAYRMLANMISYGRK